MKIKIKQKILLIKDKIYLLRSFNARIFITALSLSLSLSRYPIKNQDEIINIRESH